MHDYESFLANVKYLNSNYDTYFAELDSNYRSLSKKAEYSRWVYLLLYLLGTAITLIGIKKEIPS